MTVRKNDNQNGMRHTLHFVLEILVLLAQGLLLAGTSYSSTYSSISNLILKQSVLKSARQVRDYSAPDKIGFFQEE